MCVYYHTYVVFHYSDCDKNVMGKWEGRGWFRGTSVREAFTKKSRILETQNLLTDADSSTNTFFPLATPKGLIIFFFWGAADVAGCLGHVDCCRCWWGTSLPQSSVRLSWVLAILGTVFLIFSVWIKGYSVFYWKCISVLATVAVESGGQLIC